VDAKREVHEFLTSRRARLTPAQVGLPTDGVQRRVPGLRREEVAVLAGVSVDYYNRLERGEVAGASDHVLDGIARALRLDDAELTHLLDLVRAIHGRPALIRRTTEPQVRPGMRWLLDAMNDVPAWLLNRRADILAANALGRALLSVLYDAPERPVNICRFVFLDPRASDFLPDWDASASQCVAALRAHVGQDPDDRRLSDLIGELSLNSKTFRTRWAEHDVRFHETGIKRFQHPAVGDLTLSFNQLEVAGEPGLALVTFVAEPGSHDAQALELLASGAAAANAEPSRATSDA
jgi:transcriptional regulator with XRE-family HTH domain